MYEHQGDGNEELTGTVTLLHADTDNGQQLLDAITSIAALDLYTPGQVRRYARRVTRAFPAGQLAEPSRWDDRTAIAELWPTDAQPIAVDSDGHVPHDAIPPLTMSNSRAAFDQQAPDDDAPPALGSPLTADEPSAEHQEYQWDGGEEADEQARESLEIVATNTLKPGDKVDALRSSGMLIGWVVVSDAYIHANRRPVIDIAEPDTYADAQRRGDYPAHYIAEALDHVTAVDA